MYRRLIKALEELGYNAMVHDGSLYADKGLLLCIITKLSHKVYRVECIDTGNDITFVSRVNTAEEVVECIEQQRNYFVL